MKSRMLLVWLVLSTSVAVFASERAARADFLCCNMLAPGSACTWAAPGLAQTLENLDSACPNAGASGAWVLTISTSGRTGGATVGTRSFSPPWEGVCLNSKSGFEASYSDPDSCVSITPTGGLATTPVTDASYATDTYMTMSRDVIPTNPQGYRFYELCFSGSQARILPYPWSSTRATGSTSCTTTAQWLDQGTPFTYLNTDGAPAVPDVDNPPFWGTLPQLSGPSTLAINGAAPQVSVSNAYAGFPVYWTTSKDGSVVEQNNQNGTTASDGSYTRVFPPWSGPGSWTMSATINGYQTNTLSFTISPQPISLYQTAGSNWVGGGAPTFSFVGATSNAPANWTTTFNGQPVARHPGGVLTGSDGTGSTTGPAWTTADVGVWTEQVTVNGTASNQLTFRVLTGPPPPQPAPAMPAAGLGALAVGMAGVCVVLIGRRKRSQDTRS
jgi:hypothetical protein